MNRIFTVLSAVLLSASLWAQAPQSFSYQAVIRNSSNALVSSTAIGMKISLLQGSTTGNAVYVETHTPTTNSNGLVSISIGGGTVVSSGTFASVDWANGPYFVKTETDAAGGANYSLTTTSQLLSVPFALYAANSQPGPKGDKGDVGTNGTPGVKGDKGDAGADGSNGSLGAKGDQGIQGDKGLKGDQGLQGEVGPKGDKGDAGADGSNGSLGAKGDQGIQGDKGLTGDKGLQGEVGPKGDKGATGDQGLKGDQGVQGGVGAKGDQGLKGDVGAKGEIGTTGTSGNGFSNGTATNQIMYWNGNAWVTLNPGTNDQFLTISNGNLIWTLIPGYAKSITDIDGNLYKTVNIGNQQWMAENLKVTKYNDGTDIPNVTGNTEWTQLTTGAWTYYNNDIANNVKYGKLYNWYTVSPTTNVNKNVCPTGWHVPTYAEWTVLTGYLDGTTVAAGGKMKEAGTTSWNSPNTDATNTSLFTGLPGGYRGYDGGCVLIGNAGYWWSSTEDGTGGAWSRYLVGSDGDASSDAGSKSNGLSVRCLRD